MAKKSITIIASEETFRNLSTFTTIEELNKTVRYYKEKFQVELSKSTLLVLDQLHRYSCKFLGVSFRTKNNIAESLNISRKTVQRACKVLEDLGLIKQLEMKRKSDMRQTSNAIQIMPISDNVQQDKPELSSQEDSSLKQDHKEINTIRTQSVKSSNQLSKQAISLLPNYIDSEFARISSYFFQDADTVELFRIARIHSKIAELSSDAFKLASLEGLKALAYKVKQGKVTSVRGYFDGIMRKLCRKYWLQESFLSVFEG